MGVSDEMKLHVDNSLEELKNRAASFNLGRLKPTKLMYLKSLDQISLKISEAAMSRDQEMEYIFMYRYVQVCTKLATVIDPPSNKLREKIDLKKYSNNANLYMDKLEKLETILKERYNELKNNNQSYLILNSSKEETRSTTPVINPDLVINSPTNGSLSKKKGLMSCEELKSFLRSDSSSGIERGLKPRLLVIDCRSKAGFEISHLLYKHLINIPEIYIEKGLSASKFKYCIQNKEWMGMWDQRHSYDTVLLVDDNFTESKMKAEPQPTILILKDILSKWDLQGPYKSLMILDGGFEEFQDMFPQSTTNPSFRRKPKSVVLNSSNLNTLNYPEVPELEVDKPKQPVKPTINRLIKPKTSYTGLKEFKEQEKREEYIGGGEPDGKTNSSVDNQAETNTQEPMDEAKLGKNLGATNKQPDISFRDPSFLSNSSAMSDKNEMMEVDQPSASEQRREELTDPQLDTPSPQTSDHINDEEKLSINRSKMSAEDKASLLLNLRKVKPKSSLTDLPIARQPSNEDSSDEEETVMLKRDENTSGSNMKRSLSTPNIAKGKDDDMVNLPSFSRSNKPSQVISTRYQPSPFILGENMEAVYGKTQVGLTGLKNFANNCYMNSILQCLSNTEPLVKELINLNKPALNSKSCTKGQVANVFITALRCIWSGEIKVYSIRELKNLMGNYKNIFKGANHQDSHEFLIILLEYLHDDLNIPSEITVLTGASESSGEKAWGEFRKKNQSVIQHLFYGQEQSSVTCKTCGHRSVTFDHFFNLSVPIPDYDRTTLEDCIKLYLSGESIVWTCPKCKVDRSAVKKLDITRLPPILIIALKRFSHEVSWLEKKETLVTYPLESLEMRSFTLPGSEQRHARYNLHALSTHTGTLRAGHYRAICQNHVTTKWYLFDDTSIHSISQQEVRNNPEVYILFYHAVK